MAGERTAVIALLALALGAAGCLRFGYKEHEPAREKPDAGGDDAGSGGSGNSGSGGNASGAGGSGGSGGQNAIPKAGRGGAGSGIDDPMDAALHDAAADAATDADTDDDDGGVMDGGGSAPWCPTRSDILFCNGFEDDEFDEWSYTILDNGTADPNKSKFVSGETSLHATTGQVGMNNQARKAARELGNTKSGDLWMRYDYYLPSSVAVTYQFSAGVMSEIEEPFAGFSLLVLPSRIDISSMSGFFQGTTAFPRDRWVCVELHVKIDASSGLFEVYLDGDLKVTSPPTNTLPGDGYSVAEVGVHYAQQGQGPVEVYVDNVAIGRMRIPCN